MVNNSLFYDLWEKQHRLLEGWFFQNQKISQKYQGLILWINKLAHPDSSDSYFANLLGSNHISIQISYQATMSIIALIKQLAESFLRGVTNYQLHTIAARCGYQLRNHHHALADAEACVWIAREILYLIYILQPLSKFGRGCFSPRNRHIHVFTNAVP